MSATSSRITTWWDTAKQTIANFDLSKGPIRLTVRLDVTTGFGWGHASNLMGMLRFKALVPERDTGIMTEVTATPRALGPETAEGVPDDRLAAFCEAVFQEIVEEGVLALYRHEALELGLRYNGKLLRDPHAQDLFGFGGYSPRESVFSEWQLANLRREVEKLRKAAIAGTGRFAPKVQRKEPVLGGVYADWEPVEERFWLPNGLTQGRFLQDLMRQRYPDPDLSASSEALLRDYYEGSRADSVTTPGPALPELEAAYDRASPQHVKRASYWKAYDELGGMKTAGVAARNESRPQASPGPPEPLGGEDSEPRPNTGSPKT